MGRKRRSGIHFDSTAASLRDDMREAGWQIVPTANGHFKGLAPDGKTIQVITSRNPDGRGAANQRARFERWKREEAIKTATRIVTAAEVMARKAPVTPRTVTVAEVEARVAPDRHVRHCQECGETVDTRDSSNKAWQVHVMQHRMKEQVSCPDCDWKGVRRSYVGHRRKHEPAPTEVPQEERPAPTPQEERPAPAPPEARAVTEDTLPRIVNDLLALTTRLEAYENGLRAREKDLQELMDVVRRLMPDA